MIVFIYWFSPKNIWTVAHKYMLYMYIYITLKVNLIISFMYRKQEKKCWNPKCASLSIWPLYNEAHWLITSQIDKIYTPQKLLSCLYPVTTPLFPKSNHNLPLTPKATFACNALHISGIIKYVCLCFLFYSLNSML